LWQHFVTAAPDRKVHATPFRYDLRPMFERYRPPPVTLRWPVRLRLTDGRTEFGSVETVPGVSVADAFNADLPFIAWRGADGLDVLLSKTAILSIETVAAPVADHLKQRQAALDELSAHAILGVKPGAGQGAIRSAYRALALQYHPDRFASAGLPPEMADYVAAVFARITAAYRFLSPAGPDASAET